MHVFSNGMSGRDLYDKRWHPVDIDKVRLDSALNGETGIPKFMEYEVLDVKSMQSRVDDAGGLDSSCIMKMIHTETAWIGQMGGNKLLDARGQISNMIRLRTCVQDNGYWNEVLSVWIANR
jgi:hypothetical protein